MKITILITIHLLLINVNSDSSLGDPSPLIVIEQDYDEALKIASKEGKLLFIDFYTEWCAPCKQLDKLIFENDSIKQILSEDFVLLRYNAENDTIFHLSKKHHINSYPTGLVLSNDGYVINRKYGFQGSDFESLSTSVLEFTSRSLDLSEDNIYLKGYSSKIDKNKYPKFYIDYINRTNTKLNPSVLNDYWISHEDLFSEEYFSTLIYFARDASDTIANRTYQNRAKYLALYGETDVDILFYFLITGKFKQAISEKSQVKYEDAVLYARNTLDSTWVEAIIASSQKELLKAENRWGEIYEINKKLKDKGEFDNGYINHFSWSVYKDCEDQEVIEKCLKWMKDVISEEPTFEYLDTYAFLMYKAGNKAKTRKIALKAIELGKKENRKTKGLEELLTKL